MLVGQLLKYDLIVRQTHSYEYNPVVTSLYDLQGSATRNSALSSSGSQHRERVSWCTISWLERKKCLDWARAIEDVNIQFEGAEPFKLNLDCAEGAGKDHCMSMIDDERADMILLDPGEIGVAGRYHSLTPIMVEKYGSGSRLEHLGHYSVAVVRKRSSANIQNLSDLFGKRACFSGVSHMASWTLPLASLIDLPRFEIADCNNLVRSASYFFGNSCAPNALINKFNPTGDNPQKMSELCERQNARVGSQAEPYTGAFSALKCLAETRTNLYFNPSQSFNSYNLPSFSNPQTNPTQPSLGSQQTWTPMVSADVAFLPHNILFLAERLNLPRDLRAEVPSRSDLELLCPQGGRAPLDRWQQCNFGFAPAHAVVVSSRTSHERREAIQKFLSTSVQLFSGSNSHLSSVSSSSLFSNAGSFRSSDNISPQSPSSQQQVSSVLKSSPLSPFDASPQSSTSNANNQLFGRTLNTNFRINGDQSFVDYPSLDVLFSSDMVDLAPLVGVGQTFKGFLNSFPVQPASSLSASSQPRPGDFQSPQVYSALQSNNRAVGTYDINSQTDYFEKLRRCPVPAAVLCVTSDKEFNKCQGMSKAFHAAGLKPELNCKLAQSSLACMQLIKNRDADLVVLDAADIYIAGVKFGLIPIVAEQFDMHGTHYYSLAVAKTSDQSTDLFNLKSKLTCHSGYLKGAGWVMPMHLLYSNDRIRKYDNCNSARSAAEHFDKSCAPGAMSSLSTNLKSSGSSWTIRNLCELCHGTGQGYCARDASEPFYGDTGAFRCLVEGGGQVAFCKHTTLFENTGGSNRETWARNLIRSDFELLCRDGTRAPVDQYERCNLGPVPANAILTRGSSRFELIDAYVNLFMYGQQYYGSKYTEEYTFKMFSSTDGHDLIFQDATQQLVRVPLANQTYNSYLNREFIRAMESIYCGA